MVPDIFHLKMLKMGKVYMPFNNKNVLIIVYLNKNEEFVKKNIFIIFVFRTKSFNEFIKICLNKDPEQRPTAGELLQV